jgi:glyoxylate/hydroxypyruvate reductase A
VFTPEPLPAGHRVWTTRNLVVTPHVSAADPVTYYPDTLEIFFRNLAAWRVGGDLPNLVDVTHGY